MSRSFFRAGNDDSSSSSSDDSGDDFSSSEASSHIELAASPRRPHPSIDITAPDRPGPSQRSFRARRPIEEARDGPAGGPSSSSSTTAAASAAPTAFPSLGSSDSRFDEAYAHGRDILIHTLLEDRCISEAAEQLSLGKDHPDVKSLAREKYRFMSVHLNSLGLISTNSPSDHLQPLRQTYRNGLDFLSFKGAGRKGPLMKNSASAVSINDSMNTLLTPPTLSPAYQAGFSEMQRATASGEMPPFLVPLCDHPLLSTSRYAREFEDHGILGRGGFGKVYKVSHNLDGKQYAIKRIELGTGRMRRIRLNGQAELDGLLQEARVLAKLDHPNIVRYYSCWLEYLPKDVLMDSQYDGHADSISIDDTSDFAGFHDGSRQRQITREHSFSSLHDHDWDATAGVPVVFERSDSLFERSEGPDYPDEEDEPVDDHTEDSLAPFSSSTRSIQVNGTSQHRRPSTATVLSITPTQAGVPSPRSGGIEIVSRNENQQIMVRRSKGPPLMGYNGEIHRHQQPLPEKLTLTLHIQMTYYPLTLSEYLSVSTKPAPPTDPSDNTFGQHLRHCFHIRVSLQILLSILNGLDYLHSEKLVHRDLKPANIFLSFQSSCSYKSSYEFIKSAGGIDLSQCRQCQNCKAGLASSTSKNPIFMSIRIGDFGLVTDLAQPTNYTLRHVGTEIYRPPPLPTIARRRSHSQPLNQLDGSRPNGRRNGNTSRNTSPQKQIEDAGSEQALNSHKIDVYSLGIILFEMLYPTFTRMERHEKITDLKLRGIFPAGFACLDSDASEKDVEISGDIKECILKMVERDERDRASCREVREYILAILAKLGCDD